MSTPLKSVQIGSIQFRFYSTHFNSIPFNAIQIQIKSIQTIINSIQFNFSPLQVKSIVNQFNWIQFQLQHQFKTVQFERNSISCQFQINSIHVVSKSILIQGIAIQLQLNFNSISIQLSSSQWKSIFWCLVISQKDP